MLAIVGIGAALVVAALVIAWLTLGGSNEPAPVDSTSTSTAVTTTTVEPIATTTSVPTSTTGN